MKIQAPRELAPDQLSTVCQHFLKVQYQPSLSNKVGDNEKVQHAISSHRKLESDCKLLSFFVQTLFLRIASVNNEF